LGVKYIVGRVETLSFEEDGSCAGAKLTGGEELTADRVILCTGAYTAKLIADSAPHRSDLQVNGRMVAAAAIMCLSRVPQEEMKKFTTAPIVVHPMSSTPGMSIPSKLCEMKLIIFPKARVFLQDPLGCSNAPMNGASQTTSSMRLRSRQYPYPPTRPVRLFGVKMFPKV
jgi:hypothetical protein